MEMSKNESHRIAKSRLLPKRSLNSMKKPKILDPRFNSFMTKTLKNIEKGLPQMDYNKIVTKFYVASVFVFV